MKSMFTKLMAVAAVITLRLRFDRRRHGWRQRTAR